MTSRSLVVAVRPATSNIGNDLIALGMDSLVRARWPLAADILTVPSSERHARGEPSGLTPSSVYQANQLADAVIVGGGNLFENGAITVLPTSLGALTPPLALLAVSAGRIHGRDGRLVARTDRAADDAVVALCARADCLLVRDAATESMLADLGVAAEIGGCPSLFLDRYLTDLPEPAVEMAGTALVSVRHPSLMSVPYAAQGRVAADVAALVAGLRRRFDRVLLLCHDRQDLSFAAAIDGVDYCYTEDPRQAIAWLRGCSLSVGYRLHAFLTACGLGVPALHLSYDERGSSMTETIGATDLDVSMFAHPDPAAELVDRVDLASQASGGTQISETLDVLHDRFVGGVDRLGQLALLERESRTGAIR